jgi:GDP-L-fucose synthase
MLFQGARALNKQFGLNYICAVPSTLYGPGYHTDGRQMHFIFDLIRKIIRGKEYGEQVALWGDGNQKREIVFVEDFVRILWSLVNQCDTDIFNIGAGQEYSIRTFAEHICEIVGYDASEIAYDTTRYVGAKSKCLNIEKARSTVPYQLTPLKVGLKETIDWFYGVQAFGEPRIS